LRQEEDGQRCDTGDENEDHDSADGQCTVSTKQSGKTITVTS
jgi:hypothetical protein